MTRLRTLLGAALRRHRHAQQRTLREVAAAAGISLTYLSEIERGRKEASSEVLSALCDALGASLSALLREVADRLAHLEAARAATPIPIGFQPAAANGTTNRAAQTPPAEPTANTNTETRAQIIRLPAANHTSTRDTGLLDGLIGQPPTTTGGTGNGGQPTVPTRRLITRHPQARILDFQSYRARHTA